MTLLILSTASIALFVRALRVAYAILMPTIIVFCITGAYSLKTASSTSARCSSSASSAR